jgi:hypothetical protein
MVERKAKRKVASFETLVEQTLCLISLSQLENKIQQESKKEDDG